MKRLIPILALIVPMALAGCSQEKSVEARNASVAEVAEQAQAAVKMQPGEWVMKMEVIDMSMPGIKDPQAAQMMKDQLAKQKATTTTDCVTAEEAAQPPARMFAGDASSNCKYEHFTMGGGKIDGALVCGSAGPNDVARHSRMAIAGTFTSTAIDTVMQVSGSDMNMKARFQGKWVGACKPGQDKQG